VNTSSATETRLPVEADSIAWVGTDLFMITDEAKDGKDWDGDPSTNKLVLVHWSSALPNATFVDVVAADPSPSTPTPRMIATTNELFYVSGGPPPSGAHTSTIHVVSPASPLTHAPVATDDATASLAPSLLVQDEGLVFLALDETVEARDLNGDTDSTDKYVLALLDGTRPDGIIHSTKLAMADGAGPFRGSFTGAAGDWQVGFLVSEAAQGATNFNNYTVAAANLTASWLPSQCVGTQNNEATDKILFFIQYFNWAADPITNPPRNTGLAGSQTIAVANGYIATITPEEDEGCDLNANGEMTDNVVRWTQIVGGGPNTPILPMNDPANIHAVFDVPGGTHGLAELQQGSVRALVIEVSEAADDKDINGDNQMSLNLIGWLVPSTTATPWDFTHSGGNNAFVSATWMGVQPDRSRLGVALSEAVGGISLNPGGDTDIQDSVPTFATFSGSNLIFPGVAVAVQAANAGIVSTNNFGFFRVDEAADNRDWNGDGDKADIVLMRVSFSQSLTTVMGTLDSSLPGTIPVTVPQSSGAFLFNEATFGATGTDVNSDGTKHPFVAHFHF
jgi:hypothetical protein